MDASAPPPPPLRARAYDPTTDASVYDESTSAADAAPAVAPSAPVESKVQTEFVDVYLLAPEELRAIELKDFTIMKPKNNKMHRLVRYYPRCEITYTAAPPPPPPEEKIVTSPHGTTTVLTTAAPRHNGGFSNPSRNAEVFRLKRKLLNEYVASVSAEYGANGATEDASLESGASPYHPTSYLARSYKRPGSPSASSSYAPAPKRLLPQYTRVQVGDEDTVALTSERTPALSLKARVQYIDSLWPTLAPMDDEDEIMDYYGLEVTVVPDEEPDASVTNSDAASPDKVKTVEAAASPAKTASSSATSPQKTDDDGDDDEPPEMTVETRASALQKIKDAEMLKVSPVASKQDDWVQCDKCQKWRRLPNHVNVSELPATWYCKMNRWDKRFNKCSAPEEKIVVLMKESDLLEYRERKFALDFLQRVKRMEKALAQYKYSEARDDDGTRKFVECAECHKKRPLLGGMDPAKIAQPFVCWMNWDELRASCSAPQGALPSRDFDAPSTGATSCDDPVEKSAKKSSKSAGTGDVKHDTSAKRPSKSGNGSGSATGSTSTSTSSSSAKRKPAAAAAAQTPSATAATDKTGSASAHAKKPKRR